MGPSLTVHVNTPRETSTSHLLTCLHHHHTCLTHTPCTLPSPTNAHQTPSTSPAPAPPSPASGSAWPTPRCCASSPTPSPPTAASAARWRWGLMDLAVGATALTSLALHITRLTTTTLLIKCNPQRHLTTHPHTTITHAQQPPGPLRRHPLPPAAADRVRRRRLGHQAGALLRQRGVGAAGGAGAGAAPRPPVPEERHLRRALCDLSL